MASSLTHFFHVAGEPDRGSLGTLALTRGDTHLTSHLLGQLGEQCVTVAARHLAPGPRGHREQGALSAVSERKGSVSKGEEWN